MNRKEQAVMLHKKNFNCAQATACTFCNVMGHDPVEVFKLAEPLVTEWVQQGPAEPFRAWPS